MVDDNLWTLISALIAGMVLGGGYFGGLWVTVRRLPQASSPAFLALLSFWIRLAGCALGFYVVMGGHWQRLVMCFLGFLGMRVLLVRHWQPKPRPLSTTSPPGRGA